MKRIEEPELMTEPGQVEAYGNADFEEPHSNFVKLLGSILPAGTRVRRVLDLGCGAGDITIRVAGEFPEAGIDAVDGSEEMLSFARRRAESMPGVKERIRFIRSMAADFDSGAVYDAIISNSLLHHLPDPGVFWEAVKRLSSPRTFLFAMDLLRPVSEEEARRLVALYAEGEPEILKRDFFNSLLAAFEPDEVRAQLDAAGLMHLKSERTSDRHIIIYGVIC